MEGVQFYTRQKMTLLRWFKSSPDSYVDPVWNSSGLKEVNKRLIASDGVR